MFPVALRFVAVRFPFANKAPPLAEPLVVCTRFALNCASEALVVPTLMTAAPPLAEVALEIEFPENVQPSIASDLPLETTSAPPEAEPPPLIEFSKKLAESGDVAEVRWTAPPLAFPVVGIV